VGHGRAARGAEVAFYPRRGLVDGGLSLEVAELLEPHADVGGDGRGDRSAAALAMAMHDPLGLTGELILDRAALAAAGGRRRLAGNGSAGIRLDAGSLGGG